MKRLSEFFEEPAGGLSASRLLMLGWGFVILGVWTFASIHAKALVPIDNSVITMFGVAVGGKVVQRFGEKNDSPPPTP